MVSVRNTKQFLFFLLTTSLIFGCKGGGGGGSSGGGGDCSGCSSSNPPSAVTGLVATAGDGHIELSWNSQNNINESRVYYNTSGGVTDSDATFQGGSTSATLGATVDGTTYYFKVKLINSFGESNLSSEVSAVAGSSPQSPLVFNVEGDNQSVKIYWSESINATSYNLYWSTSNMASKSDGTKISNVTSPYTHSGLTNGTKYYYMIEAVNSIGGSQTSNAISTIADQRLNIKSYFADIYGITHNGASRWVFVGDKGMIYTSDNDGSSFTIRTSETSEKLNSVAYGNSIYLAAGENGVLLKSTDGGITWSRITKNLNWLNNPIVKFVDSKFYIIYGPRLYSTSDGTSFDEVIGVEDEFNPKENGVGIASNGSVLVFLRNNGVTEVSSDGGSSWTSGSIGTLSNNSVMSMTYGNSKFLVAKSGDYYSSSDGTNWTNASSTGTETMFYEMVSLGSNFYGVYLNRVYESTDNGASWSVDYTHSQNLAIFWTLANGNSKIITSGQYMYTGTGNGTTWSDILHSMNFRISSMAFDGTNYMIAGGDGKAFRTTSLGGSWTSVTTNTSKYISDLLYEGGKFVGVASISSPGYAGDVIYTNSASTAFTVANYGSSTAVYDITYDSSSSKYILGGRYITRWDTDPAGTNTGAWHSPNTEISAMPVNDICDDDSGQVVIVSNGGLSYYSSDSGNNWSSASTGTAGGSHCFYYSGAFYSFDGDFSSSTQVYKSIDGGDSWTPISTMEHIGAVLSTVDLGTKILMTSSEKLMTSSNMSTSILRGEDRMFPMLRSYSAGGEVVIVGDQGLIATHPGY